MIYRISHGVAIALFFTITQSALAAVTVVNGGFESPDAAPFSNTITGWTKSSVSSSGVVVDTANGSGGSETPDDVGAAPDDQWAFFQNEGSIWQDVGSVLADATYTVNFTLGDRTGHNVHSSLSVAMWAGGTGPTVGEGATQIGVTLLATLPVDDNTENANDTQFNSLVFSVTGAGLAGQDLWLLFSASGTGRQTLLDGVSVTESVSGIPSPAALPAGLMLLGLAAARRRRTR